MVPGHDVDGVATPDTRGVNREAGGKARRLPRQPGALGGEGGVERRGRQRAGEGGEIKGVGTGGEVVGGAVGGGVDRPAKLQAPTPALLDVDRAASRAPGEGDVHGRAVHHLFGDAGGAEVEAKGGVEAVALHAASVDAQAAGEPAVEGGAAGDEGGIEAVGEHVDPVARGAAGGASEVDRAVDGPVRTGEVDVGVERVARTPGPLAKVHHAAGKEGGV